MIHVDVRRNDRAQETRSGKFPNFLVESLRAMTPIQRVSRRGWMAIALLAVPQAGCGTIFWPERKGQPAGPLDPKVVILDALGLLLFFIPGVIAFAVDFNNGTIYLPPGDHASTQSSENRWKKVRLATRQPTASELEKLVRSETGKEIQLRPGTYSVGKLESPDALEALNIDQTELAVACDASHVRFRGQSE